MTVAVWLYRSLRKIQLPAGFQLHLLPRVEEWGSYESQAACSHQDHQAKIQEQIMPWLPVQEIYPLTQETYRKTVRTAFESHRASTGSDAADRLDQGFDALRLLFDQLYLHKCSSACETEGVLIQCTSAYCNRISHGPFRFSYQARVTNNRDKPIQVLGRGWSIKNAAGVETDSVEFGSNGVVGQTPIIPPGASFQYTSGSHLPAPRGSQEGRFKVAVLGNGRGKAATMMITANIERFQFLAPPSVAGHT